MIYSGILDLSSENQKAEIKPAQDKSPPQSDSSAIYN